MEVLYKPSQWNNISDMLPRLDTNSPAVKAGDIEPEVFSCDIRGDMLKVDEGV